jgi:hypothetical protein
MTGQLLDRDEISKTAYIECSTLLFRLNHVSMAVQHQVEVGTYLKGAFDDGSQESFVRSGQRNLHRPIKSFD